MLGPGVLQIRRRLYRVQSLGHHYTWRVVASPDRAMPREIVLCAGSGPEGGIMLQKYRWRISCLLAGLCFLATASASADCVFTAGNSIGAGQAGLGYAGPTGATGNR